MKISWSKIAKIDYWNNIEYLEREWTLNEVYNFMDKVDELIDLLAKSNVSFKSTSYKNIYQVPVLKQITLYYKYENDQIELLRFWNNYQDIGKFTLYKKNWQLPVFFMLFVFYNNECLVITSGLATPIKSKIVGAISPRTPS